MFSIDAWQEIFEAIRTNKVRSFATAFGVFWGILMLILLLGAGQGLQNGVQNNMLLDAINSIWIIPARTSMAYQGMPAGREHPFIEDDLQAVSENIEGIDLMSPENQLTGNFDVRYYWTFQKRDGLTWYEAMRELYTEGQMGGFVPTPTPAGE